MARFIIFALLLLAVYFWWRPDQARALFTRAKPFLPVALALLYLASPIDLIPDAGLVGMLDDLIVLATATVFGLRLRRDQPRAAHGKGNAAGHQATADADPYEILGVRRGASPEEITRAYREKMKRYHPDRVSGLGEELQRIANDKTIEIQRAYEVLRQAKSGRA